MKKLLLFALVLLSASCGAGKQFTLLTYNVGVFTKSGTSSLGEVAAIIKEVKADAVSLNELDSCTVRTGGVYQIEALSSALGGWNYAFAKAIDYQGGGYGIGIVSSPKLKVLNRDKFILDKGEGTEYRACAVAEFEDFIFLSTHLEHRSVPTRLAQIMTVDQWVQEHYKNSPKPVFLCGDLNSLPESDVLDYLGRNWTVLTPPDPTIPSWEPKKCIDYILVYNNPAASRVKVRKAKVLRTASSGDLSSASDHLPVLLKLTIR